MIPTGMPQRFNALLENLSVIYTALGALFASAAAAMPELVEDAMLDNSKMRLVCIVGALFGSLISVLVFPPKQGTARIFATKIVSSSLVSVVFTPLAFHWQVMPRNTDLVLVVSATIAILGVGIIRAVKPRAEKAVEERIFGKQTEERDE